MRGFDTKSNKSFSTEKPDTIETLGNGDWRCPNCSRINAKYVGTCACGLSKQAYETKKITAASTAQKDNTIVNKTSKQEEVIQTIKNYKELLDMGAITQEEYDTKKKELLESI